MYPDLRDYYGMGYHPYMMGYGHPSYGMWDGSVGYPSCGIGHYVFPHYHYGHHHHDLYYGHPQNIQIQSMSLQMPSMMHP
jgi:hypothetical protein